MKTLYILRHGQAEQSTIEMDDFDRALTPKGCERLESLSDELTTLGIQTQQILCSTSKRTRQTAEIITKDFSTVTQTGAIQYDQNLYLPRLETLYNIIAGADESLSSLMIIGHNPGLHQISIELSGSGDKNHFEKLCQYFPPGAFVELTLDIEHWYEVTPKCGILRNFIA